MKKNEYPFVSIVMPIRNEADYIERTINSILRNDYPSNKMEVLVTDGCSDDETQTIVNRIAEKDSRVKLLQNKGRIVSTGLNMGLKMIKGDIFIRIDGHCEIPNDFIDKSVRCLLERPEAWIVGGYWKTISKGYVGHAIAAATQSSIGVGNAKHRLGNFDGWVDTVPYGAHHKWVLEKVGYFDEELVRNQDDEFNMRVCLAGGKIWISSNIYSTYYSRSSLKKLWHQYFQYGFWRIRTMQKHKRPATFRQIVPLLFVSGIIGLAIGSLLWPPLKMVLGAISGFYLLGLFAGSVDLGRKNGWRYTILAPLIFMILHFAYGTGSMWGIVRFALLGGWKMKKPQNIRLTR
jgi:succinoglycan biosynthesis protein ExoA